jgi:hypothetical protein
MSMFIIKTQVEHYIFKLIIQNMISDELISSTTSVYKREQFIIAQKMPRDTRERHATTLAKQHHSTRNNTHDSAQHV